ncbi:Crp/Fnr family transcriptional regulator [Kibdelosporangium phytohabitans]|uniref:Crp/Fnr family transcriptional regulator n=1 Tax=Kibdelosporangium phytohabitans TaxID=860235 RepID=A0A0N9HNA4_9PSEU|nr:Crp/Fnr family transcriptional regulator [Kibdelosporangium phytohabitans]ALG08417.1 hypothetical protein AOZ06_17190 [Kibdelosporangium phytohabitans]MBE1470534.1 CRP-like cAMP-binding protein [Kibdelosporangium phytohabitans]
MTQASYPPARTGLFATLPPAAVEALLDIGVEHEFHAGDVLVHDGDRSTHVLLLLSGYTKVTATSANGGLVLLAIRVAGEFVGELAGLDGLPRSATVTAAGTVRARVIPQPVFQDFLAGYPAAALEVSRSVAAKLRVATRRRVDLSGYEVPVRVARVLAGLVAAHGVFDQGGWEIRPSLSQPELAALVGAAEPTVHKALRALREQNVVDTRYRRIRVVDLAALRAAATAADG